MALVWTSVIHAKAAPKVKDAAIEQKWQQITNKVGLESGISANCKWRNHSLRLCPNYQSPGSGKWILGG